MNYQLSRTLITKVLTLLSLISFFPLAEAADNSLASESIEKSSHIRKLYKVTVTAGRFRTASGASRLYTLYIPQPEPSLPRPPYPFTMLIHGFLMTGKQQANNAHYFAERGFVVMTPNLSKVLLGDKNRMHNIHDLLDELTWAIKQSQTPKTALYGLIDLKHIGIAGNSSGGAVCLELLIEAQKASVPIHAMCSLEGVPWDRSWNRVPQLEPTNILTLRGESELCNYHARMLTYLHRLKFPMDDVKINGAHHCDAENPTSIGCICVCGKTNVKYRLLFQYLTYLYLKDTLNAPNVNGQTESFAEVVQDLEKRGQVVSHLNNLLTTQLSSK